MDVAERDRAVVALQHQRVGSAFRQVEGRARRSGHVHVALHQLSVQQHAQETRRLDLLAGGIEARRTEPRLIGLPLTGTPGRVHARRGAADAAVVDPLVIDAAEVRRCRRFGVGPAVEDLHLVQALQVHARVRALGQHELEIQLDVAELASRAQVRRLAGRPVQDDAAALPPTGELRRAQDALVANGANGPPLVGGAGITRTPARERRAVEQRLPPVFEHERRIAVGIAVLDHRDSRRLGRQGEREQQQGTHGRQCSRRQACTPAPPAAPAERRRVLSSRSVDLDRSWRRRLRA